MGIDTQKDGIIHQETVLLEAEHFKELQMLWQINGDENEEHRLDQTK